MTELFLLTKIKKINKNSDLIYKGKTMEDTQNGNKFIYKNKK